MRNRIYTVVLAGVGALAVAGAAWSAPTVLKPGAGQQTVQTVCSGCHAIGMITTQPRSADEWNDVIGRMIEKGLVASDDQLDEIANYLTTNYGPASTPSPPPHAQLASPPKH